MHTRTQIQDLTELALHTQILAAGLIIIDHNGVRLSSAALMDADGLRLGKHLVTFSDQTHTDDRTTAGFRGVNKKLFLSGHLSREVV